MPANGGRRALSAQGVLDWLSQPVDIAAIVYFRMVFGIGMVWQIYHEFDTGNADHIYFNARIHFSYFGFEWLKALPHDMMYALLILLALLGACIALGLFYRIATIGFFLGWTYLFLLDKAAYQNHLYLICLLSFLMIFLPANRAFSLDIWRRGVKPTSVAPAWTLWILLFQFSVVYFFGGIAKLNADWLNGQPIGLWLGRRADWPVIGPFVHDAWFVGLFTFGGLLLDLFVVPALLWKRTRRYAYLAALSFHLINSWIFEIGIFPWLMIAATALYFEPDWPRKAVQSIKVFFGIREGRRSGEAKHGRSGTPRFRRPPAALIGVYVVIQLVMPLRHFFYPGDANWTEEGHYFSWHMMLRYKEIELQQIVVKDPTTNKTWTVQLRDYMALWQARNMLMNPDMILQFSHYLAREKKRQGVATPQVFATVRVSLNGRNPQLLLDPNVDLASQPRTLAPKQWVMPLL